MKTFGNILLILMLLGAFVLFYLGTRHKDIYKRQMSNGAKKPNKPAADTTQTVVVDPVSGDEMIVSDYGEDNLDGGVITAVTESNVSKVVNFVSQKNSQVPSTMEYRVYDSNGGVIATGKFSTKTYTAA